RARRAGGLADRRRRAAARPRRSHLLRGRGGGMAPRRDDRRRRRGAAREALARRALVPHAQRGLAPPPRDVRLVALTRLRTWAFASSVPASSCGSRETTGPRSRPATSPS